VDPIQLLLQNMLTTAAAAAFMTTFMTTALLHHHCLQAFSACRAALSGRKYKSTPEVLL